MNAATGARGSGAVSRGQMLADRAPMYDKVFKRKPRKGRPRKSDAKNLQYWVK